MHSEHDTWRKWTSGNENNAWPGLPRGYNGHDGEGAVDQYDGGDCENLKHREMLVVMNLYWFEPNSLNIHWMLGS